MEVKRRIIQTREESPSAAERFSKIRKREMISGCGPMEVVYDLEEYLQGNSGL